MGFFDRLAAKKNFSSPPSSEPTPESNAAPSSPVRPLLTAARVHLEAQQLPAALGIYEEVLSTAGDRADVLVTISGDLGSTGYVASIIELIAPRYDAQRHGPATGLNLLQAYLALRNADAAQHILDILFSLERPELEERLHGFSNAIADLIVQGAEPAAPASADGAAPDGASSAPKVALVSISKPIWFYGLEPLADQILPAKGERVRRIAFAQLALPGAYADVAAAMAKPEDELGRLSRAIPLWLAETFYFSAHYAPIAAVGVLHPPGGGANQAVIFSNEWTTDNLRQLVASTSEGLDYVVTGALRQKSGDFELLIRIWEVKKFRERKQFIARWNPASCDAELSQLQQQFRAFMEWSPEKSGLPYTAPASPRAWLEMLGASLGLFLAEKKILPVNTLPPLENAFQQFTSAAATTASASLAWLTLQWRAGQLGIMPSITTPALFADLLIDQARETTGV